MKSSQIKKREGNRLKITADSLYIRAWTAVWSIPQVVSQCSDTTVCVRVDLNATTTGIDATSEEFLKLAQLVAKRLEQAGNKKGAVALRRKMKALDDENSRDLGKIPSSHSVCG